MLTSHSDPAFHRAVESLRAAGTGHASWTEASRLACDVVGADAAAVIVVRGADHAVELMEGYGHDPALISDYDAYYHQHDVLAESARRTNEWQVSDESYPANQWGAHPFFGGFLRQYRVAQILVLTLHLSENVKVGFSFHRHTRMSARAADFQEGMLPQFTQHAVRAFETREVVLRSARQSLADALTGDNMVCFLAGARGRIEPLSRQGAMTTLFASRKLVFDGRGIRHTDAPSNTRLQRLLANAAGGKPGKICLRANGVNTSALRFEAQPAPETTKRGPTQKLALVRVTLLDASTPPDEEDLRALFGLTPTEGRVLRYLCDGLSVKACAERLRCAEATVRTHIAHLMNKMHCARQGQLVRAAMVAV